MVWRLRLFEGIGISGPGLLTHYDNGGHGVRRFVTSIS